MRIHRLASSQLLPAVALCGTIWLATQPAPVSGAQTIAVVSPQTVAAAIEGARQVLVSAYVLEPSSVVVEALERAGDDGSRAQVLLPGDPYDPSGFVGKTNAAVTAELHRHRINVFRSARALHLKAVVIAGAVYLDDTNFGDGPNQTIVADHDPADAHQVGAALTGAPTSSAHLQTTKAAALQAEAALLLQARGPVAVESESFGWRNPVYDALLDRVRRGASVQLIVAQREVEASRYERKDLERLASVGVQVRISFSDEKMAIAGRSAWVGSANATRGVPEQLDWGLTTTDPSLSASLAARFARTWAQARPLAETPSKGD
ncbi:hypothetical protein EPN42_11105 [bacterium]|nr:MAG: hypothetical protein EPN42_11105 [bacterium]